MKYLPNESMDRSKKFIKSKARKLERAIFDYEFESGSLDIVLQELSKYQNEDGGFGNALEPDIRCQESSAIATTVGLQCLSRLRVDGNNQIVQKAIQYLLNTHSKEHMGWEPIPKEADNAPRAPWWNYVGVYKDWGNPNAEILGYFYEYSDLVSSDLLNDLTAYAINYLNERCELKEMHEMFCFVRLANRLPADKYQLISDKLDKFIENCVIKNQADRQGYCAYPLQIVDSPESQYYEKYKEVIPQDLDGIIDGQEEDGAWAVNWSWGCYEEEWEKAKEEWKGVITLGSLLSLKSFNRLND
ncbi:hypothetical protein C7121_21710 [Paenibacillus glucanolyticus]|jgi:hypothetical protein|uniref:hypothetical protein n=1 Tax=Paenibacillus glucanolyticus TaxID=59843 RepID=UPI00096D3F29|nr:hypothetical protein [Paenibacillus glucanolyticus]AVV58547.1 hypothetical protein C7121_21710 [Paenibacillus glucanolyticus]MCA4751063.1 hypothetical protein [Mycolicibacterium fortuitum]OMF76288.1 hypothetical protein BK142_14960 [Paenibacillus glucanolyticus]